MSLQAARFLLPLPCWDWIAEQSDVCPAVTSELAKLPNAWAVQSLSHALSGRCMCVHLPDTLLITGGCQ